MATAGIPVDLELKKAFQELQQKLIATQQQLKVGDVQIETLKRQNKHSDLVRVEISSLVERTPTYLSVGRMFLLTPKDEVVKTLDNKLKSNEEKIKSIEAQKAYLQNSMKEAENSLRELITTKQRK